MSRQPWFVLHGQRQHVIQRGNNRDVISVSDNDLMTPHERYLALGKDGGVRRSAYRVLFDCHIDAREMQGIRDGANKSWYWDRIGSKRRLKH